ncbi:MAG TPA: DNA repair protein MmcB-related protein [Alphaproteobacteria bacterium]|nr:DNA repair protein MmcB-related protein [Alphaproteobacteria bacterium]HBA43975.1 DNA repair protein MmcB-related protein [Alphaproteobacteria bacterium]HBC54634.1 DNA repair protein MmcB-related protein [Alphaproteobacteria bacterium]HCO91993.1 DNA repair protein MmcB-related protein [Alphaproteobacteria bacterium]
MTENQRPSAQSSDGENLSEPAAAELTNAVAQGVERLLRQMGLATLREFTLANGRRADVAALSRKGEIVVVEIKVSVADFRADGKWPEYLDFCDRFFFAVPERFPRDILPADQGLIIADQFGGAELRPAPEARISAARRKAVTLRFARKAAERLWQEQLANR